MGLINRIREKARPYVFAGGLGLAALTGCDDTEVRREESPVLHEDARVADVVYAPSRHGRGSDIAPTYTFGEGGGLGMSFVSVTVNIPAKYAVVFECPHGKFIIEGTDEEHKKLWEKLRAGQEVDVSYKELFNSTYSDKDKDGEKELIAKSLVKYDFLDAVPKSSTSLPAERQ